jgi:hypothetical protein
LKKTSLGPLRQGQRLDTSETKQGSSKECKPLKQSSNNHKELLLHTCKLPWTNAPPPGRMHANHLKTGQLQQLPLTPVKPVTTTGQTGVQHVHRTSTHTGQTGDLDRSDRWPTEPRNGSKPPENHLNASSKPFQAQTPPLLAMHESSKKCKTFNLELLK